MGAKGLRSPSWRNKCGFGVGSTPRFNQIVVGIIDTGINTGHPDLKPESLESATEFHLQLQRSTSSLSRRGRMDAIKHNCNPRDSRSHGTHVAGIIGARGGNGIGVNGVNWYTSLMAIKAFDFYGAAQLPA